MTFELPLDSISINTNNLLYQQCAEEFIKAMNSDANKVLELLQKINERSKIKTFVR